MAVKKKKHRIKDDIQKKSERIRDVEPQNELLKFSFKYIDLEHEKFNFSERKAQYFFKLFERLKILCLLKTKELLLELLTNI